MASNETIEKIINPLLNDEEFRREFQENREAVLDRYQLTSEERESLANLDVEHLVELGESFAEYAYAGTIGSIYIKS